MTLLFTIFSCSKEQPTVKDTNRRIGFEVSSSDSDWNKLKSSICPIDGYNEGHDTLFLYTSVSDRSSIKDNQTKGTIITEDNFYPSMGVHAFTFDGEWTEELTPNWFYNEEVTKESGWSTEFFWPSEIYNIRFFAYAPYDCDNLRLSDRSATGAPTFDYTVPSNVAEHKDIVVAASKTYKGNYSGVAELEFTHALTAVRFVAGNDLLPGRITKVALKGVYANGTYSFDSNKWTPSGVFVTFSQDVDVNVDGIPGQPITAQEHTFMMLPQTLPTGAKIEIDFIDNLTSEAHTLEASIAGTEWEPGKLVSYRISTSSISIEPTLSVEMPEFTHEGGTKNISITSYATITSGSTTTTVTTPWTAEFVEEDGNGGYRTIEQPDWITDITLNGEGGTNSQKFSISIKPQEVSYETPHDDALKEAEPVSGIFDLSTNGGTEPMSTSNCYIVNAPGTYSLPLVYGNAIKNGTKNSSAYTTEIAGLSENFVNHRNAYIADPYIYNNSNCEPDNATLVWQDAKNLVNGIRLDDAKQNLIFTIDQETIKEGNAVIALKNSSNEVMWSWHIWVTDMKAGTGFTTVPDGENQYQVLNRNVGECYMPVEIYYGRKALLLVNQTKTNSTQIIEITTSEQRTEWASSPIYQWGYKNPVIGWSGKIGELTNKTWYDAEGNERTDLVMGSSRSIPKMIKNPGTFFGSYSNMSHTKCNLWNNDLIYDSEESASGSYEISGRHKKTIYDPCPRGCAVLPYYIVELIEAYPYENRVSTEYREIYNINGYPLYMSIPGTRDTYTGELNLGSWSKCWTSLHRVSIGHKNGSCDAYGRGVRPFKEL